MRPVCVRVPRSWRQHIRWKRLEKHYTLPATGAEAIASMQYSSWLWTDRDRNSIPVALFYRLALD